MTHSGTADGVVRNGDADWVYEEEILAGTGAIGPGRHRHSALPFPANMEMLRRNASGERLNETFPS